MDLWTQMIQEMKDKGMEINEISKEDFERLTAEMQQREVFAIVSVNDRPIVVAIRDALDLSILLHMVAAGGEAKLLDSNYAEQIH